MRHRLDASMLSYSNYPTLTCRLNMNQLHVYTWCQNWDATASIAGLNWSALSLARERWILYHWVARIRVVSLAVSREWIWESWTNLCTFRRKLTGTYRRGSLACIIGERIGDRLLWGCGAVIKRSTISGYLIAISESRAHVHAPIVTKGEHKSEARGNRKVILDIVAWFQVRVFW